MSESNRTFHSNNRTSSYVLDKTGLAIQFSSYKSRFKEHAEQCLVAMSYEYSLTKTYYLAYSSREKLIRHASDPDHKLRLLVGHANLQDALIAHLANEKERETTAAKGAREPTGSAKVSV